MKTSGIILFSAALVCLAYLTSCNFLHKIEGNGNVKTEIRIVNHFTEIRSEGSFEVYISYDSVQSVKVEAEENLISYIETDDSGSVLIIKTRNHVNIDNNFPIKVFVKTPDVKGIELSGSGLIKCDSMKAAFPDLNISGSGEMNTITQSNKIKAHISGSGDMNLSGAAYETYFNIDGSGDIHAYNLQQDTCFADISGSGDIYVYVIKYLDVRISGSGKVHYQGNPIVNSNINGSGKVIHE